jgi:hypothetical protein
MMLRKIQTGRINTYREHLPHSFYSVFTQIHNLGVDGIALGNTKGGPMMGVLEKAPKFGLFNSVERLVGCDNPFRKKRFKFCLIPFTL